MLENKQYRRGPANGFFEDKTDKSLSFLNIKSTKNTFIVHDDQEPCFKRLRREKKSH